MSAIVRTALAVGLDGVPQAFAGHRQHAPDRNARTQPIGQPDAHTRNRRHDASGIGHQQTDDDRDGQNGHNERQGHQPRGDQPLRPRFEQCARRGGRLQQLGGECRRRWCPARPAWRGQAPRRRGPRRRPLPRTATRSSSRRTSRHRRVLPSSYGPGRVRVSVRSGGAQPAASSSRASASLARCR